MPCCFSNLLTTPVFDSSACEWLSYLAIFQACWWCMPLALSKWVATMYLLMCLRNINDNLFCLPRQWVVTLSCSVQSLVIILFLVNQRVSESVPCWIATLLMTTDLGYSACECNTVLLNLLTMLILGSPGSEWLPCHATIQLSSWYLLLTFSKWVAVVPCYVSNPLMLSL